MSNHIYIVFDLDETIGQFGQLYFFIRTLTKYSKKPVMTSDILMLISKYTKYFRPYMFDIFNILKKNKIKYPEKIKVIIYSNNKIGNNWIDLVRKYIEFKIKFRLFNDTIGPFMITDKVEDKRRTTNSKTFEDLSNIIACKKESPIMFIDNSFFKHMNKENIFYLLVEPYEYQYTINDLINIYLNEYNVDDENEFRMFIHNEMNRPFYKNIKMEITKNDIKNGREIMIHLKNFLSNHIDCDTKKKKYKTLKRSHYKFKKTRRDRTHKRQYY